MIFNDRKDAGIKLAEKLKEFENQDAVVYALPRGGVPIGYEIAKKLKCPLKLIFSKKIGHPSNPEYAICAVTEEGTPICNEKEIANIDSSWLEFEILRKREEIYKQKKFFLVESEDISTENKIAIIVDDGIATGFTIFAAIKKLKNMHPKKIFVAIPVTPKDIAERLKKEVDGLIALEIPEYYKGSVGAYYKNFGQISNDRVNEFLKLLKKI